MQSAVNRAEYHTITLRSRHDERRLKNRQILTQGPSQLAALISLIWLFLRSLRLHVHVSELYQLHARPRSRANTKSCLSSNVTGRLLVLPTLAHHQSAFGWHPVRRA